MSSFFSRISGYFDASYAGRYEAIIIQEVARECPALMTLLFNDYDSKKHKIELEYYYSDFKGKSRRADLAVLQGEYPVFLMEIKFDDSSLDGQLESYVDFVKGNRKVSFLYLTKNTPTSKELENLQHCKRTNHVLFSDLCVKMMKTKSVYFNSYGKMYIQYLKEVCNMFAEIDKDGLEKFLTRMFLPWGGNKRVRKRVHMVETIPTTFKNLMGNIDLINNELKSRIDCQMTVDYTICPYIQKINKDDLDCKSSIFVEDKNKAGGIMWVYASGSFSEKPKSITIEYGMKFDASIKRSKKFKYVFYAAVGVGKEEYYVESNPTSAKILSDKKKSIKKLVQLIMSSLEDCVKIEQLGQVKRKLKRTIEQLKCV